MIEVFDNIIDLNIANEIEEVLSDDQISWFFSSSQSDYPIDTSVYTNFVDIPQMTHMILENGTPLSPLANLIMKPWEKLITHNKLTVTHIRRVKVNLNIRQTESKPMLPHPDHLNSRYLSALYYVNDCDGDTFFYNSEGKVIDQVSPAAGRFILFPSSLIHAGSSPSKSSRRMIINFLFSI